MIESCADARMKHFNIPNLLTVLRVLSVPVFIYLLISPDRHYRLIAFVLFALASVTDLIDGYLARKWNQETEFGKFLDPLADKFLVLGTFMTFLFLSNQVEVWMVLLIVSRDMLITVLRYLAIAKGKSLRTSMFGKVKTAFQMFAIVVILVSLFLLISYRERNDINAAYDAAALAGLGPWDVALLNLQEFLAGRSRSVFYGVASFLPYYLMIFTTVITVWSGLRYIFTNYRLLLPPYPFFRNTNRSGV